jgi:hypothetical protein
MKNCWLLMVALLVGVPGAWAGEQGSSADEVIERFLLGSFAVEATVTTAGKGAPERKQYTEVAVRTGPGRVTVNLHEGNSPRTRLFWTSFWTVIKKQGEGELLLEERWKDGTVVRFRGQITAERLEATGTGADGTWQVFSIERVAPSGKHPRGALRYRRTDSKGGQVRVAYDELLIRQ